MAMESGLMVYPMGGTIDGKNGDHVLLAPPFIVNEGHIEKISTMLIDAISLATSYNK
jgi:adenosylmethionine-8-amino-7-oxononanoate aminotransferase